MTQHAYVHGTDRDEQQRLAGLNALSNAAFVEFLELDESSSVLEVGSGLGILTREVARRVPRGFAAGVEASREQLAWITATEPNVKFVHGDAHALDFADGTFDVVYCRYLLEHVHDPARVLAEMRRVLKDGGKVFVQENNILVNVLWPECPRFDSVWSRFATLQQRMGGDPLIGKKLLPLLRNAGFRDVRLTIQPEVHHSGEAGFRAWIENQIGNVRGAAAGLEAEGLALQREVDEAIAELRAFAERDDASAFFYWNRAAAVK